MINHGGGPDVHGGGDLKMTLVLKEHSANRSPRRPSWLFFVFEFVNLVVLFLQFAECSFNVGWLDRVHGMQKKHFFGTNSQTSTHSHGLRADRASRGLRPN